MTTMQTRNPITVSTETGTPTIHWEMTVEAADTVLTLLASAGLTDRIPVDALYAAISQASDAETARFGGCEGLWPDAATVALDGPAVLGSSDGDMLAVLIPGSPDTMDAIATALSVATEAGASLDLADENLMAEVWKPRWMVLNACESANHDFHPELAPHGPQSPGAVLVTRVDLG